MVGLVKQSLLKATGRANLTKKGLEDILLDIESVLNNQPVIYIDCRSVFYPFLRNNPRAMEEVFPQRDQFGLHCVGAQRTRSQDITVNCQP